MSYFALLRRLFAPKPERHYIAAMAFPAGACICKCGFSNVWDYDLRRHFEETGRIGK